MTQETERGARSVDDTDQRDGIEICLTVGRWQFGIYGVRSVDTGGDR